MESSKDQSTQPLTASNILNIYPNLKPVKLIKKCLICLECRSRKNSAPVFLKHVKTRHFEKSKLLLAK